MNRLLFDAEPPYRAQVSCSRCGLVYRVVEQHQCFQDDYSGFSSPDLDERTDDDGQST